MYILRLKQLLVFLIIFLSITFTSYTDEVHNIQKGETIYQISRQYGIPMESLIETNHLADPSSIVEGQVITIPSTKDSVLNNKKQYTQYSVEKGDTLYGIAHTHNISLLELKRINNNLSDAIRIGQVINVPLLSTSLTDKSVKEKVIVRESSADRSSNNRGISNFSAINIQELFSNAKSVGSDDNWPINGDGYMIQGKLPGLLIEGKEGQTVQASTEGVVLYAALHSSFNNVVIIQGHDGVVYVYAGQRSIYVSQGDVVEKGSVIGELGVMPILQKPLLYFSVWQKDKFLDPRTMVS